MQFSILKIGALISIFILGRLLKKMNAMMNLNTNRGIHMRKGKFLAYSNLDVIKFSVPWKDCLLFWEFYGLKLPHLGKLRSRRGVLRWSLCFNFRVGLRVHWCSTLCSLWPSLGRHPWGGGEAIGPAERNINTTFGSGAGLQPPVAPFRARGEMWALSALAWARCFNRGRRTL